ncbi:exodeoxyribonuclease X [Escherichia coli]|uniref:Exodeoxyribonuclease X n=1 Tax=Escherichia coli TaxID=562 RepID=A0A377B9Q7_ECOLX|nr:exodeoxyribonuclease X [Escherichia coli]
MLRIIDTETCGLQGGIVEMPLLMSLTEKSSTP